jgi:hypothetical protein
MADISKIIRPTGAVFSETLFQIKDLVFMRGQSVYFICEIGYRADHQFEQSGLNGFI